MAGLEDKLRCPFCLEEIDYLENPKLLPCTHLYCTECLTSHSTSTDSGGFNITCSICSKSHQLTDLSSLAKPETNTNIDEGDDGPSTSTEFASDKELQCDNCKEKNAALCFCVDCGRKLCRHHEEVHIEFFGEQSNHQIVSTRNYAKRQKLYIRPKCKDHGYDIGLCCEKCRCLKCAQCKIEDQCEGDEPHVFRTLADTEIRIRSEFAALEKKCSEKQTEMCKKEKETWQEIDKLEEECGKMNRQVDEKTERLVKMIREEAGKFKRCIKETERWRKLQLERDLHLMREKRAQLEAMQRNCSRMIRDVYATELIKCREGEIKELETACNEKPADQFKEPAVEKLQGGIQKFLDYQIIEFTPDTLICVAEQQTNRYCYSVKWSDNALLSCGTDGVTNFDAGMNGDLLHEGHTNSLCSDPTKHYMVTIVGSVLDEKSILVGKKEKNCKMEVLCRFRHPDKKASFITVHNNVIVATAEKGLIIYNKQTHKEIKKELNYQPEGVCFTEDGELLVAGWDNILRKYTVDLDVTGNELIVLWTCQGISHSRGICLLYNGLILVASQNSHQPELYVISQGGKLLKTISHSSLSLNEGGISIHGATLAVPFWAQRKFMLFTLM